MAFSVNKLAFVVIGNVEGFCVEGLSISVATVLLEVTVVSSSPPKVEKKS